MSMALHEGVNIVWEGVRVACYDLSARMCVLCGCGWVGGWYVGCAARAGRACLTVVASVMGWSHVWERERGRECGGKHPPTHPPNHPPTPQSIQHHPTHLCVKAAGTITTITKPTHPPKHLPTHQDTDQKHPHL
jgi:hypothetical protein